MGRCNLTGKEQIDVHVQEMYQTQKIVNPSRSLLDNCASPGLFISEFQLPSGLLIVHPGLGTAILCMVGHSNGAPGA